MSLAQYYKNIRNNLIRQKKTSLSTVKERTWWNAFLKNKEQSISYFQWKSYHKFSESNQFSFASYFPTVYVIRKFNRLFPPAINNNQQYNFFFFQGDFYISLSRGGRIYLRNLSMNTTYCNPFIASTINNWPTLFHVICQVSILYIYL